MKYLSILLSFLICITVAAQYESTSDSLWYKKAVIYSVDVEVFKDSDGDGTGDFRGLASKLSYLDSLGITALWLAPFQPTPNKDDGYDIADYYTIDPRLGNDADFMHFMQAAKKHRMRVIMDLVVNHTSNAHPWFQEARSDKNSPYRDWYVWSETKPENIGKGMVFPGVQESIWTYDTLAGAYYYHRFYEFQPDLNMQNPAVQAEVKKIAAYWLKKGIDGFRLDGVPFFIEVPDTKTDAFDRQFDLLTDLCAFIKSQDADAIVLGEANVPPNESKQYFGEHGEGLDMIFNFFTNQQIFYTLASGHTKALRKAIKATGDGMSPEAQWVQFLRNHDEVDLGRLSKSKRQKVYDDMGPQPDMQLYDRGIRRRLAPMLGNNRSRMELAYSLMLSLPGTPALRYGDEIGMGDDLSLPERMAVRTPMQWSSAPNGGFSTADSCVLPLIDDAVYGYKTIQVAQQQVDTASFLNWSKHMLLIRKACPGISMAACNVLPSGSPHVLIFQYIWEGSEIRMIHNFSPERQSISIHADEAGTWQLLTGVKGMQPVKKGKNKTTIKGYGYSWYKVK